MADTSNTTEAEAALATKQYLHGRPSIPGGAEVQTTLGAEPTVSHSRSHEQRAPLPWPILNRLDTALFEWLHSGSAEQQTHKRRVFILVFSTVLGLLAVPLMATVLVAGLVLVNVLQNLLLP